MLEKADQVGKADAPGAPQPPGTLAALAARPKVVLLVVALLVAVVSAVVSGSGVWPADLTFNLKPPFDDFNTWLVDNRDTHWIFLYFLLHIANTAESSVDSVVSVLDSLGVIGVTVAAVLIAWYAGGAGLHRRALRTAGTALAAFLAIGLLGVWDEAMDTLGLMVVCVIAAALVGVVLGMIAGLSERGERILRPVLDTMQVLPAFSYLLPFVLIFGTGIPSAFVATVIYAAPPMARLTALGLRGADAAALEASRSLGATYWQQLATARLPLARKQMLLGLNQTIMMCLSMVVLASMIGSGGLGELIYKGLQTLDVGQAALAGIAIVLIAIWLDRTTAAAGERIDDTSLARGRARTWIHWAAIAALTTGATVLGSALGKQEWPDNWVVDAGTPINNLLTWIEDTFGSGIPVLGGTHAWADGFANHVLNPVRDGLQTTPGGRSSWSPESSPTWRGAGPPRSPPCWRSA